MKNILLLLSSVLLICACTTQPDSENGRKKEGLKTEENDPNESSSNSELDGLGFETPFFLTGVTVPHKLHLKNSHYPPYWVSDFGQLETPCVFLILSGDEYGSYNKDEHEIFMTYAKALGDGTYTGRVATPNDHQTLSCAITRVEVNTLYEYDSKHPAGTSLNDLVVLSYQSFYPFISSGYKDGADAECEYVDPKAAIGHGTTAYKRRPLWTDFMIRIPKTDGYPNSASDHLGNMMGFLEFTQAPDEPKQKIRVTLTLENGEKLLADTEIDFTVKP